jgi:hypothetical protein
LYRKASAIVTAAAAKGQLLEHDVAYGKLKDKLGERTRKGKDTAVVDGRALEQLDAGQLGAVKLVLENRDLAVAGARLSQYARIGNRTDL